MTNNITTFVQPVQTLDYYFLHLPESREMLCIKRGVEGFWAPLCKKYDSWQEAKGYADGMNWLNCKMAGIEPSDEVVETMLKGAMFGWKFRGPVSKVKLEARVMDARKNLGCDRLLHEIGLGWGEIVSPN